MGCGFLSSAPFCCNLLAAPVSHGTHGFLTTSPAGLPLPLQVHDGKWSTVYDNPYWVSG